MRSSGATRTLAFAIVVGIIRGAPGFLHAT
jgi:hypothetical protein